MYFNFGYFITISVLNICVKSHSNDFKSLVNDEMTHNHGNTVTQRPPEGLEGLWDKYEKHDFMHDLNHLKEETNKLLYLQESEQISTEQSAFYYTKLHDFNSDGRLDGLELLLAVKHSFSHHNETYNNIDLEEFSAYVDQELQIMDLNRDGFVDYGEIYTYMESAKKANPNPNPNPQQNAGS